MSEYRTITLENPADRLMWMIRPDGHVEILDIVVGSERGKGRGRRLVIELIETVRREHGEGCMVFAITRHSNAIAIQFYLALGFRQVALLNSYYKTEHGNMYGVWI